MFLCCQNRHSFCAQTESYGVGQAEWINAVSILISGVFLVLFALILLAKWTTLVQFGSQSLPAEKETRPLGVVRSAWVVN